MLPNRIKFFFAGRFLDWVNPRIAGEPHRRLSDMVGRPQGPVLDLCAGTAYVGRLLARDGLACGVVALDLSPELLSYGRRRARYERLAGIDFVLGNATALPFDGESFDVVVSAFGLHELSRRDRHRAMMEVVRVLAPGGRILIADIDSPQRFGWMFRAYLFVSHGAAAREVLGPGLRDSVVRSGLRVVEHRSSLGGSLPFQLMMAIKPVG